MDEKHDPFSLIFGTRSFPTIIIVGVPDTNLKEHETNQHITCKLTHYFHTNANFEFWMRSYDKVDLLH